MIGLLVHEARISYAGERRRQESAAARLAAVRSRVLASLRCAIALDIEGFLAADRDPAGITVTCHNSRSAQGFVVSRTGAGGGKRKLTVDLEAGALSCRYDSFDASITRASERRVVVIAIGYGGSALRLREGCVDRTFATVDALGAFLLSPILGSA